MTDILNREWRDENNDSNYPFEDSCNLTTDSGYTLSPALFIDAVLYAGDVLSLTEIEVTNTDVFFRLADSNGDLVGEGQAGLGVTVATIPIINSAGVEVGALISDTIRMAEFQSWPIGIHTLPNTAARFVAAICFPAFSQHVSAVNDLGGVVWLVGGAGVTLSVRDIILDGVTRPVIRADAVGDPLAIRAACAPGLFQTPRFLQKLIVQRGGRTHTLLPNEQGDIQITVGSELSDSTILRIIPELAGVSFSTVGEKLQGVQ